MQKIGLERMGKILKSLFQHIDVKSRHDLSVGFHGLPPVHGRSRKALNKVAEILEANVVGVDDLETLWHLGYETQYMLSDACVKSMREKCRENLTQILEESLPHFGIDEIEEIVRLF